MALRVKSRHIVKPSKPTWNGILPLSELDQIGAITHTTTIYFYQKPTQDLSNKPPIETLIESLSRVLVPFFPLAGRLHWIDQGGRLELECNAMGVEVIEAEYSKPMSYFRDFKDFEGLIPHPHYSTKPMEDLPLLLAQLTRFECGGLCLGCSFSHAIVDGRSGSHFATEWARLTRGEPLEAPPYLDRGILQTRHQECSIRGVPYADHVQQFSRLPKLIGEEPSFESEGRKKKEKEIVATMLPLSRGQVQKLKKVANVMGIVRPRYGSSEVIAAHVWRCACKARGHKREQLTALCFTVDARDRMDPPLPSRYFGNAIIDVVTTSQVEELIFSPLSHVCSRIREMVLKVTNEYVCSAIDFFKTKQNLSKYQDRCALGSKEGVVYGNPNIGVASWLNLPLVGLDFGWGKEVLFGPGCCEFDGDIMILPGLKKDGSVVVAVGLQASHMEKFKKYFYEDIDALDFQLDHVLEEVPLSIPSRI